MKMHTPIFILGLLVFITPILGLPQMYEQILFAVYGIAIMLLISNLNAFTNFLKKEKKETEASFVKSSEIPSDGKEETQL
jgi:uncharacterized membrane protein YuzA (DUF378 family)